MNLCFFIGKIVSDIEFNFILDNKNISIVKFVLEVDRNCTIVAKAYDKVADWCYQKLVKGNIVAIQGKLDGNIEVIVENIEEF